MTLSCVWLRSVGDIEELVFATDSRLRGPFVWDACPKMLALPRSDSALCFAGDTSIAYPIMLQVQTAIRQYPRALNRAESLSVFKGKLIELINGMRQGMHSFPQPADGRIEDETFLVLGGFCWREADFRIWTLHFDRSLGQFTFRPASFWPGVRGRRLTAFVGDCLGEARDRLRSKLIANGKHDAGGFDMEPFEVIRDMLREEASPLIGGPPQVLKVYRHMNATPFAVYWPDRASGRVTLLGREFLSFERPGVGTLDPDSLAIDDPAAV